MDPMLEVTIVTLEDRTWQALMESGASLLPFLARDCIMLFPMGMKVSSKTTPNLHQVLTSEAFVPWSRYRMSDVHVTPLGSEAAQVSYRVFAVRQHLTDDDYDHDDDGDRRLDEFRALVSSTWRKDAEAGRWMMCLHQQTPYEEEA